MEVNGGNVPIGHSVRQLLIVPVCRRASRTDTLRMVTAIHPSAGLRILHADHCRIALSSKREGTSPDL